MSCKELILIFCNADEPRKFSTGQYIYALSLLVRVFVDEVTRSNLRKLHEETAHTRARPMLAGKTSMLARRSRVQTRPLGAWFSSWERGKEEKFQGERATSVSQLGGI